MWWIVIPSIGLWLVICMIITAWLSAHNKLLLTAEDGADESLSTYLLVVLVPIWGLPLLLVWCIFQSVDLFIKLFQLLEDFFIRRRNLKEAAQHNSEKL